MQREFVLTCARACARSQDELVLLVVASKARSWRTHHAAASRRVEYPLARTAYATAAVDVAGARDSGRRGRRASRGRAEVDKDDPAYRQVLALTGQEPAKVCLRCKYDTMWCPSLKDCVFDSNVFVAGKELPCRLCLQPTLVGEQLITKLSRGPHAGNYVHQWCARAWYEANPRTSADDTKRLRFHEPPTEMKAFAERFARGEIKQARLDMTAGAGKTNAIIFVVSLLRELKRLEVRPGALGRFVLTPHDHRSPRVTTSRSRPDQDHLIITR